MVFALCRSTGLRRRFARTCGNANPSRATTDITDVSLAGRGGTCICCLSERTPVFSTSSLSRYPYIIYIMHGTALLNQDPTGPRASSPPLRLCQRSLRHCKLVLKRADFCLESLVLGFQSVDIHADRRGEVPVVDSSIMRGALNQFRAGSAHMLVMRLRPPGPLKSPAQTVSLQLSPLEIFGCVRRTLRLLVQPHEHLRQRVYYARLFQVLSVLVCLVISTRHCHCNGRDTKTSECTCVDRESFWDGAYANGRNDRAELTCSLLNEARERIE